MATLFDMYKDVATPDIYQEVKASRQETEGNTKKTQDTAFGMLKKSNIGTLQQQYRAGTGRFYGITDPDKKFQVYYDALKALDPQAAQDASKVYAEERQRRINREVADAYKAKEATGNDELDAIKKAITELQSSIDTDEAQITQQKIEDEKKADQVMQAYNEESALNPNIDTGRQSKETPKLEIIRESDWSKFGTPSDIEAGASQASMKGYTPSPNLKDFYSTERKMPTFDVSLGNEGSRGSDVPYNIPLGSGTGMEGYTPYSNYTGYDPTKQTLANFYRGI